MYILEKRQILANGRHEVTYNEFKDRKAAIEWLHVFDGTMSTLQSKGIIHAYRIKLKEEAEAGQQPIGESKELQKAVRNSLTE